MPLQQKQYCEICDTETDHIIECIRDATIEPDEETCTQEAMIFYANGDSIYRITCPDCGCSKEEI